MKYFDLVSIGVFGEDLFGKASSQDVNVIFELVYEVNGQCHKAIQVLHTPIAFQAPSLPFHALFHLTMYFFHSSATSVGINCSGNDISLRHLRILKITE